MTRKAIPLVAVLWTLAGLMLLFGTQSAYATGVELYAATNGSGTACSSPSPCTLGEAISLSETGEAGNGVTIDAAAGTYSGSFVISGGTESALELRGGSGAQFTTIDGGASRAIQVNTTKFVEIEDFTITNNSPAYGNNVEQQGGGTLNLYNDVIDDGGDGTDFSSSVDVYDASTMHLQDTTVENNAGSAVEVDGSGAGLTITDSTLSDNAGGGIVVGGGVSGGGVTVTDSTITGNGSANVSDPTHDGDFDGVLDYGSPEFRIFGSTITGNENGGVVMNSADGATIELGGDIIAGNTADSSARNCYSQTGGAVPGTFVDDGYNFSDDATCAFSGTSENGVSDSALGLGALADNGSFPSDLDSAGEQPSTQSITAASVAHDAVPTSVTLGSEGFTYCSDTDERGEYRNLLDATSCDAGAFQVPTPVTYYASPTGSGGAPCLQGTPCSLTSALTAAAGTSNGYAATIELAAGTYNSAGTTLVIDTGSEYSLAIDGAGAGSTLINGAGTTDGTLEIDDDTNVSLGDLTLENGSTSNYGSNLYVTSRAAVNLDDDVVSGGDSNGSAVAVAGVLNINDSTISGTGDNNPSVEALDGSRATIADSALTSPSGGVSANASDATVTSSTIDGQDGGDSIGGVSAFTSGNGSSDVTVYGSTIANSGGAGVYVSGAGSVVNLGADILVNNNSQDCHSDSGAAINDEGYNFGDDATCVFGAPGMTLDANIGLGGLANNGGPTQTEAIGALSDGYDVVPTSVTLSGALSTYCAGGDQRGIARAQGAATSCDAGAFQYAPPLVTGGAGQSDDLGLSITLTGSRLASVYGAAFGAADTAATITSQSETSLTLTIPPSLTPGSQPIKLTNSDGTTTVGFTALSDPTITTNTLSGGTVGTAYSQPFAASGGQPSYTYALASGSPPPGLTLSSAGVLSGTPTQGGNYTFSVHATDANGGVSAAQSISLAIVGPSVTLGSTTATHKSGKLSLKLACSASPCSGTASVTAAISKVVKGHRKTTHVKIASGAYSLSAGHSATFKLSLTAAGRKAHYPLHGTATVSVSGGTSLTHNVTVH